MMFNPEGTDSPNEFVELVNLDENPVDLSGWRLSDRHSIDELSGSQMILDPGGYAVIFEADYDTATGLYRDLLPANALILFVDDNAIGNGLSNSGDTLFLITAQGDTVDSVGWGPETTPGHSLEKVILDDCISLTNWRPSLQLLGTPGAINSVVGREIDLALDSVNVQLSAPPREFTLSARISNVGVVATTGSLQVGEVVMAAIPLLEAGEARTITFDWEAPPATLGFYAFIVQVVAPGDYAPHNDTLEVEAYIPPPSLALVINEIMYTPLTGEPEWVELLNTTASVVNLKQWRIRDQAASVLLPALDLPPGGYVVVTGDSAMVNDGSPDLAVIVVPGFPILNNTGDQVTLLSPAAAIIDAVDYALLAPTSPGRSLEKVSPLLPSQDSSSWVVSPSSQGHTAGRPNSAPAPTGQPGLTLSPNPLQINRPASILTLQYATPFPAINLHVTLYDLAGRRLGTIFNGGPVPGTDVMTWDARSLDPVRFKTGQYLLVFQARDTGSSRRWETVERLILVQ
ncbi:MAG: lamin tail domain-containing protein [Candidatus Marinimicrobia bacterium]|nr:lamin tail domain-containing protein [Candidatus Neomarinimicrobiota bacterium]